MVSCVKIPTTPECLLASGQHSPNTALQLRFFSFLFLAVDGMLLDYRDMWLELAECVHRGGCCFGGR